MHIITDLNQTKWIINTTNSNSSNDNNKRLSQSILIVSEFLKYQTHQQSSLFSDEDRTSLMTELNLKIKEHESQANTLETSSLNCILHT